MTRTILAFALATVLCGCATKQTWPNQRPLSAESIQAIGKVDVLVDENLRGVEKTWFMTDTSAAGAAYGLIGAFVSGIMDVIINAGPQRRAKKVADEIAESLPSDVLTASLVSHIREQMPAESARGISIGGVSTGQRILHEEAVNNVVEISTSYQLSEDASAFRFISNVTYQSSTRAYATPYTFKGSVPKAERKGPLYRNTFIYHSAQLPIPTLNSDLEDRLVASIQESFKTPEGALPAAGSDDEKAMNKEIEKARDGEFTKGEIAIFLARHWLANGAAMLKRETESAHAFLAKYLVKDLNSSAVASFEGIDDLVEVSADKRNVRRVGKGIDSGQYISASGDVTSFPTYGNTSTIARVHLEKIIKLQSQASAAKAKKKNTR